MNLTLLREIRQPLRTFGRLWIDGEMICTTLEDTDRKLEAGGVKIYGQTAIPRGRYRVVLSVSNRFKKLLPEVLAVPQFEGIRIHAGNTEADTDGCILVGQGISTDNTRLLNSRPYVEQLIRRIQEATGPTWLEVK